MTGQLILQQNLLSIMVGLVRLEVILKQYYVYMCIINQSHLMITLSSMLVTIG